MVEQHIESGRGRDGGGAARADRAGRPVRRDRDGAPTGAGSAASGRSRRTPIGLPDAPDQVFASMGNYVFTHRRADRGRHAPTPTTRPPSTTSAATSSRCSSRDGAAQVYDFSRNEVPGATDRDRGYWRDVGTLDALLRRAHGPHLGPPGLQPLQPGVADPHLAGPAAAGQVHLRRRRAGAARRWTRWSCAGVVISGGDGAALGALARACTCTPTRRSRTRPAPRASTSAAARSCTARSSTRTCASPPGAQIGVDLEERPRALHGLRRRGRRGRQGHGGRGRECGSRCSPASTRPTSTAAPACTSSTSRASSRALEELSGARLGQPIATAPRRSHDGLGRARRRRAAPGRAARDVDRPVDGRGRRGRRARRTRTPGTPTSAGISPSSPTASRTSRPCTRSSRCARGRPSSSAAATRCRAGASGSRSRPPTP